MNTKYPSLPESMYRPEFEHDACGVGFVANISGKKEFRILDYAIQALCNLAHRGALDADAKTGDGAGVLTQIPHALFRREVEKLGGKLVEDTDLAVGVVFMPRGNKYQISASQTIIEQACAQFGIHDKGSEIFRRNIITEEVDLNTLIGTEFEVQGVRFFGTQESAPCHWMNTAFAPGAEDALKGRGGLRAKVLSDGVLRVSSDV